MKITDLIKQSILILIILFSFQSKTYSQPLISVVDFQIYDDSNLITPHDNNYIILWRFEDTFYYPLASREDSLIGRAMSLRDCSSLTQLIIFKKSTGERMKINSVGCGRKKIIFKEGEIYVNN